MSVLTLELKTLQELDGGKVAVALAQHLRRAANDCYDRPNDKIARKVSLEMSLKPVTDDRGTACVEVELQAHVASTVPKHRTRALSLGLKPNGTLLFNPDSPDRIDQTTFLEDNDS